MTTTGPSVRLVRLLLTAAVRSVASAVVPVGCSRIGATHRINGRALLALAEKLGDCEGTAYHAVQASAKTVLAGAPATVFESAVD